MKLSLIPAFIVIVSTLSAQTDYAVTSKGDTLSGRIRILTYDKLDRVQVVVDKKKRTYSALEVKALSKDGVIYHTVKYDPGFFYMKLIKAGYLSLYGLRLPGQSGYDGQFLVKKDGTSLEVANLSFKKSMTSFLEDCEEVSGRIKSGDLGRRDVEQIVDSYNSCMQIKTDNKVDVVVQPTQQENEKVTAINALLTKVEGTTEFASKSDVLDLLKDLRSKVARNEILPNYLTRDIQKYLSTQPQLTEDLDKLLVLLKK